MNVLSQAISTFGRIKSLRSFGKYFLIASVSILMLAGVQFCCLKRMPYWNSDQIGMPKHRMIDLQSCDSGRTMVAKYFCSEQSTKTSIDLSVSIIDCQSNQRSNSIRLPGLMCAKFSTDGVRVALGFRDGRVSIAKPADAGHASQIVRHDASEAVPRDLFWSPDGRQLLVCTDFSAYLIDSLSGLQLKQVDFDNSREVVVPYKANCFALATQGKYSLFSWATGDRLRDLQINSQARSIVLSSDLRYTGYCLGSEMHIQDNFSGRDLLGKKLLLRSSTRVAIAFAPDEKSVALVTEQPNSQGFSIGLVDLSSGQTISEQSFGSMFIAGISYTPDAVWAWSTAGTICKWEYQLSNDLTNRQPVQVSFAKMAIP